jgi:GT2 family glycosyltransferase
MDLTVIIVNFNVKYFLEQSLHAVFNALRSIEGEVIVVDNHSADGSAQMIPPRFPQVKFIANNANVGFARANNQAIKMAKGDYILLLNPDTLVQEDTFTKCLAYMKQHEEAGCMGVKMIDGTGRFLRESKRALPTPWVAFYKIFGFSWLFPRSRKFGRYHLGFLHENEIHEVDVLSGAFMLIRKTALEKAGMLDEDFFMYGEDIDLSYRIQKAGYKNIYFPQTTIIHFKGESTRKGTINYVLLFYKAMIIFARKHFAGKSVRNFIMMIHLAIYLRAGISILYRFFLRWVNPLMNALCIYGGFLFFLPLWERYHFGHEGAYPPFYMAWMVPAYIMVWITAIFLAGAFERRAKASDIIKGVAGGTVIILMGYALLPESLRFSRALILFGTLWAMLSSIGVRFFLGFLSEVHFALVWGPRKKRILIIGEEKEAKRVHSIAECSQIKHSLVGFVSPEDPPPHSGYLGSVVRIKEMVKVNQVEELIFCAATMSSEQMITTMLQFTDEGVEFKIAPPESLSIIGSNSINERGDIYSVHFNLLSSLSSRRKKRLLDLLLCLVFLCLSPLLLFIISDRAGFFRNLFSVFISRATWVGYYRSTGGDHPGLPKLNPGVLTPADAESLPMQNSLEKDAMNLRYAKDYKIQTDLRIIFRGIAFLGRKP